MLNDKTTKRATATLLLLGLSSLAGCEGSVNGKNGGTLQSAANVQAAVKPVVTEDKAAPAPAEDSGPRLQHSATPAAADKSKPASPAQPAVSSAGPAEETGDFDDLLDKADAQAVAGDTEAAIATYEAASERDPQSALPHVEIARLLLKAKGRLGQAREHAELAVELSPGWSTGWNTLGRIDLISGKLDDAAEAFSQATEKNAANIYAWNNLGLVRLMQRRFGEAAEALEEACKSDDAVAYMLNNLGSAYEQLGRTAEALVAYKRGLALGSSLAGKNFVRLEKQQDLERTAERSEPAVDPTGQADSAEPDTTPSC